MGKNNVESGFPESIKQLFSSGTVMLFACTSDDDFPLLSVSENAKDILGFSPSYFLEQKNGWSDRIHPKDKEHVFSQFRKVIQEGGTAIHEYRFKTKDGSYIWLRDEIKLVEDSDRAEPVIYGSSIDITERKKAELALEQNKMEKLQHEVEKRKEVEEKLQKRLSYEKAVTKCSNLLLESTSSEALQESLDILLDVSEADRVYLYKNKEEDGELYLEPQIGATAEGIETIFDRSERKFKYTDVPWWHQKLSNREIICDHREEIPEPERSILEKQQIKSVLVIPITVDREWYGYIGFAGIRKKRTWEDDEVSLLKTAADIIAAYEKRKNIEQSLLRQRNYTETILDSLPSIYLLMDANLRFVQWNENAVCYTGYSAEELRNRDAFDLIVPEDHEKLQKATQRIKEDKGTGTELRLLTKSGEKIPYYWRGYYIELNQQKFFLSVGIDITQQKETEQKLVDEKRFNEALIESLPGTFYVIDEDGNYQRWNQNLLDEMGYSAEEIKQISPLDFFAEDDQQEASEALEKVFTEGEASAVLPCLTKDGEKIPYLLTGKLFNRDDKKYLVGVGHDISEQMEAREKLRKSEELFRNLFLKAPAAIVRVSPDNKVQNVNESFEELFGYTEEELKGKDIDEVLVPEEEYEDAPKMPGKKYAMDSFHKEAKRLRKDGTLVDVFVAAIPVFIDDEPLAGFGMYIDITEQKKYEEEIYSSLKEKHVLLKEIHHRVKNNLAVVSGLLQLQMYETDDPVVRETLMESENRIQTMALIHEKLYNSQNLSRISCDSYIGDLVDIIRNTNDSQKEISVDTDIADIELNINKAVPFALLMNEIVTNSFKHAFTDQEKGNITIEIDKTDSLISAHICDNGKGLPEEFSPKQKDTLGMTLIQNFARQLDAEWKLGSDDGTYIDVQFPAGDIGSSSSDLVDL